MNIENKQESNVNHFYNCKFVINSKENLLHENKEETQPTQAWPGSSVKDLIKSLNHERSGQSPNAIRMSNMQKLKLNFMNTTSLNKTPTNRFGGIHSIERVSEDPPQPLSGLLKQRADGLKLQKLLSSNRRVEEGSQHQNNTPIIKRPQVINR